MCSWGSIGVNEGEILSAQSSKHKEVSLKSAGPWLVTIKRWDSDITKGILQKVNTWTGPEDEEEPKEEKVLQRTELQAQKHKIA